MARQIEKLSALAVTRLKEPGLYADGGGLYLRVKPDGGKFWVFRYMLNGKAREMGLGALHALSLAGARVKAIDCRRLLTEGIDPIDTKKEALAKTRLEAAKAKTFQECAEAYIEANKAGWRNAKHADQWKTSLATYVYPLIGDLSVQSIDVALVLKVLEQKKPEYKGTKFWEARPVTANRVRNRIERILDWANAREYRKGENPARWRGLLKNLLPHRSKMKGVLHHPALPYEQIGDFIREMNKQHGIGKAAFEFLILTAARTSEVTGARWNEFDLVKKVWTIPATRIKGGREHRVPLSNRALEILKSLDKPEQNDALVFHGPNKNKPLSKMALLTLLKRMECTDITVHGFRSSFRNWAAEQTHYAREVAEMALAHTVGNAVEAAYKRTDLFDKRRKMMDAWASYCATPSIKAESKGKVVKLARK